VICCSCHCINQPNRLYRSRPPVLRRHWPRNARRVSVARANGSPYQLFIQLSLLGRFCRPTRARGRNGRATCYRAVRGAGWRLGSRVASSTSSPARSLAYGQRDKGASLRLLRRLCRAQPASLCPSRLQAVRACPHPSTTQRRPGKTKKHVMWTTRIKICLRRG